MKQSSSILLVLVYLFYPGKCQTILSPETIEMSGFLFPDGNGIADFFKNLVKDNVVFQLYTRSLPNAYTTLRPTKDADIGDFNAQRETKFLIHGWKTDGDSMHIIRKGYLEAGDYNVIVVDWSKPANSLYLLAIIKMKLVSEYVASLIDFLVTYHSLRLVDVHIIGHSLGGQLAGIAGSKIKSGKPGRITALDPAAPFFCDKSSENRLDSTDGQFVDVIHTCGGLMGWKSPIGHADFYPNGGTAVQPGCNVEAELYAEHKGFGFAPDVVLCSHARALEYFAESITTTSGFVSHECRSWDDFKHGNCFQNSRTLMGEFTNTRGSYYLQTATSPPYALGYISTIVNEKSVEEQFTLDLSDSILC